MTLRRQVFLELAAIVLLMVLALTGTASLFLVRWHRSQVAASESRSLRILADHIYRLSLWEDPERVRDLLRRFTQANAYREYAVLEFRGRPVAWYSRSGARPVLPRTPEGREATGSSVRIVRAKGGRTFAEVALPVAETPAVLHVGLQRTALLRSVSPLLERIGLVGLVGLLLGLVMAEVAAWRASREVTLLVNAIHGAMDDPDSGPVCSSGSTAEVEALAALFNRVSAERRHAMDELARQNTLLSSILEALTHPFYVVEAHDHSIVVANEAARSRGIATGTHCYEVTHGRSSPCEGDHPCPLEIVRTTGKPTILEHRHTLPDGTTCFSEIHAYPILDDEGRVVRVIEYALDITQRKEAERALRESQARYQRLYSMARLMADNLPDMVWAKDLEGRYLFANRALCEKLLLVSDPEEALGKTDTYFAERQRAAHPEDPRWHTFGEICVNSDAIVLERKAPGQFDESGNVRGRFLCLDVRKAPFFDEEGRIIGTVGSARDVTRQRAMEAERRRLQAAIEQADVAVVMTDAHGTILYVNPAYETMTGYSRQETIGRGPDHLRAQYEDPSLFPEVRDTVMAGKTWRDRCRKRRKDGTIYVQEQTVAPVRDAEGDVSGVVAFQRDVTAEVELEVRYLEAQKLESVGRLAGGIAHDFNNLLGAIRAFAELLQLKFGEDDAAREELEEILAATDRGARLTRQLLAFARSQPSSPIVLDFNEIVEGLESMLATLIGEDVRLTTRLQADLPPVLADPAQMEQVLINLVVNARDAMPEGGRLTIETRALAVTIQEPGGPPPGRWVALAVTDTGTGMSEEVQQHLFEPFFTTKEPGKGTGLGLATCFGIVSQAGGHITVDSRPGEGTTMTVLLPEAPAATARPQGSAQPAPELPAGSETLLLVEDEEQLRHGLAAALRALGYIVLEAEDGARAMELWRRHAPNVDLLLTDEVMPGMSGSDLARDLRRERPELRVIVASGYRRTDARRTDMDSTGTIFVNKPFSLEQIATLIRNILDA